MYICNHFDIHELVPPAIFKDKGGQAWGQLDDRLLITLDRLRVRYGRMTVNNYYWGGDRLWSGIRTPDSPYYSRDSQHTYGRAADCLFSMVSAEKVRQDIQSNPDHITFRLITSIELGTSWLHFDVRNCDRILAFHP